MTKLSPDYKPFILGQKHTVDAYFRLSKCKKSPVRIIFHRDRVPPPPSRTPTS